MYVTYPEMLFHYTLLRERESRNIIRTLYIICFYEKQELFLAQKRAFLLFRTKKDRLFVFKITADTVPQ